MMTTETNMKIYNINACASRVRKKIHRSLSLASQGMTDQANELFEQADQELRHIRNEHASLAADECARDYLVKQQDKSIGLNEILRETIARTGVLNSRCCGAVQFHVYN